MGRFILNTVRCLVMNHRNWFHCAMIGLALSYAAEYIVNNGPYWEPDVNYLHWSTDLPAVTVCQTHVVDSRDSHRLV